MGKQPSKKTNFFLWLLLEIIAPPNITTNSPGLNKRNQVAKCPGNFQRLYFDYWTSLSSSTEATPLGVCADVTNLELVGFHGARSCQR